MVDWFTVVGLVTCPVVSYKPHHI